MGLSWADWSGIFCRGFERWLKGTLEFGHLSLWELCVGTWRKGSLDGDPRGLVEKYLATDIFPWGPHWGTRKEAFLLGALRDRCSCL
jgi:hypothetical protein